MEQELFKIELYKELSKVVEMEPALSIKKLYQELSKVRRNGAGAIYNKSCIRSCLKYVEMEPELSIKNCIRSCLKYIEMEQELSKIL
jgi:hypothetical protein